MIPFYTRQDIIVFEGDSLTFTLMIQDLSGAPVDITAYDFAASIGSRTNPTVITGVCTIEDGPGGELLVEFGTTDVLIPNTQYEYQVRLDDTADLIKTILSGHLTVRNSLFT